jgi:phage major head subunit gpT-like protein
MQIISSRAYDTMNAPDRRWYDLVMKSRPIGTRKERLIWLLDTASIVRPQASHGGGQQIFEEMMSHTVEYEVENALVKGLRLKLEELEDKDANGLDQAAHWARQAGALFAYWPQLELSRKILANGNSYDGVAYFASNHPLNPFDTSAGTYSNLLSSKPIDSSVTVDVAVQNLASVIASIAQVKTPNGQYVRNLRAKSLIVPPALASRAQQLCDAKFIAQAAASGGGSGDVSALISNFGFGQPVIAPELGTAASGGSDTSYYVVVEDALNDEMGPWLYLEREAFAINYHGPMTDAQLATKREFQWTTEGRNVVAPGHPFLMFKCTQ